MYDNIVYIKYIYSCYNCVTALFLELFQICLPIFRLSCFVLFLCLLMFILRKTKKTKIPSQGLFITCKGILPTCLYMYQRCAWCLQKRMVSDPLELQLQAVVRHHVGAWNGTQFLHTRIKCSSALSHLSSLLALFFVLFEA